ncbi:MAG TPA: peptidoglycan-binding domain-containing protein [Chthoniobacteraceae bacterium]|jgi:hypothetical protein|nr:peptidoglycan-binding domain-containing protein [Chthoniobacteraceae bacterium]
MKQFLLLGFLLALPTAGFSESSRSYRAYPPTIQRETVRTTTVAPSYEVSRNWDPHHVYRWNDRRYRYDGGAWVIVPGEVYRYPGGFGTSSTLQDDVGVDNSPDREVYVPRTVTRVDVPASPLAIDVQRRLARRGYYHGPIDGIVGAGTRSAIMDFQADHGLDRTGFMDNATLDRLGL